MWFPTENTDISFIHSAPHRFHVVGTIRRRRERVFEIFATAERQTEWFKDWVGARWTSKEQQGIGATREVELEMIKVKERFLVWEPGKRLAFAIEALTLPLVRSMVEDLRFERVGEASTRLDWQAHYDPALITRALHPLVRTIFGSMFQASVDGLTRYAARVRDF